MSLTHTWRRSISWRLHTHVQFPLNRFIARASLSLRSKFITWSQRERSSLVRYISIWDSLHKPVAFATMKSVWVPSRVSFLVLIGSILALSPFTLAQSFFQHRSVPTTPLLGVPKRLQRTWGTTTPYFPVGKYPDVPIHCTIDQVRIQRDAHF